MSGAGGEVSIEIVDLDAPDNPLRWNAKIRNELDFALLRYTESPAGPLLALSGSIAGANRHAIPASGR